MSRFARGTDVSVAKSELEIKATIQRYGGDDIVTGVSLRSGIAFVQFRYRGLPIEMRVPLPSMDEERFHKTTTGRWRKNEAAQVEWEHACRQQWRVLLLLIKANLEAADNALIDPKTLWLPWLLLPSGQTVGATLLTRIDSILESGEVPHTIFALPKGRDAE